MSGPVTCDTWDAMREVLRELYLTEDRPLVGPDGVIEVMRERHDFLASKAQYEIRFRKWGFRKYSKSKKREEWLAISRKFEAAKAKVAKTGNLKEPRLYHCGKLVTSKVLKTRSFMTFLEKRAFDRAPSPKTPPDFNIRFPTPPPIVVSSLPFLDFKVIIDHLGTRLKLDDRPMTELVRLFPNPKTATHSPLAGFRPFLPSSPEVFGPFSSENSHLDLQQIGGIQVLSLASYLLSNNLPGNFDGTQLYSWLKEVGAFDMLDHAVDLAGPSAEALLETSFRLAVETEDLPAVEYLLQLGIDPNGRSCRFRHIQTPLTPLEFACVAGNLQLAQSLIKHGSRIEDSGVGWTRSLLVLLILGWNSRNTRQDQIALEAKKSAKIWSLEADDESDTEKPPHHSTGPLISLIRKLTNHGCAVDIPPESKSDNTSVLALTNQQQPDQLLTWLSEGHSPLTAASKCANVVIVFYLLDRGANVHFRTANGFSALHECLAGWWESVNFANNTRRQCYFEGDILTTASGLLDAKANANDLAPPRRLGRTLVDECLPVTLAAEYSIKLVDLLLEFGAWPTAASLTATLNSSIDDMASLDRFRRLAHVGTPVSDTAWPHIVHRFAQGAWRWLQPIFEADMDEGTTVSLYTKAMTACSLGSHLNLRMKDHITFLSRCSSDELVPVFEAVCPIATVGFLEEFGSNLAGRVLSQLSGRVICDAILKENFEMAGHLIKAGVDVNVVTNDNNSPLTAAIRARHGTLVTQLIQSGAVPMLRGSACECGRETFANALVAAAEIGNLSLLTNLAEPVGVLNIDTLGAISPKCSLASDDSANHSNCRCVTPLTAAILAGQENVATLLLPMGASPKKLMWHPSSCVSPLAAAIHKRELGVATALLQNGASPVDRDAILAAQHQFRFLELLVGFFPQQLDEAEEAGSLLLDCVLQSFPKLPSASHFELIQNIFYSRIALIDGHEKFRGNPPSPLYRALSLKLWGVARVILEEDADVTAGLWDHNGERKCALSWAVHQGSPPDMIKALLEAGAQANLNSQSGCEFRSTALQIAARRQDHDALKLLLDHHADPNEVGKEDRHTTLQIAVQKGNLFMIELLLERGANINAPPDPDKGATALQHAAMGGFVGIAEMLIEKGADVNAPAAENDGRAALEGAAEYGRIDMIQLLLNAGARTCGHGSDSFDRALDRATRNGHHASWRLLKRRLAESS
ncbi:ankyrin repeat-containing domain protein [Lasiosphaeria ovina]|uniref:Ankyrin repeat-containing domain protein n=1 Tax=Lasiosphaeria ovina TaxID=92902 RepID=A0AAE0N3C6_9PEZI|nr:ankyrin repeat-containing domain protein [Lasiosphaeria ovina]